MRSHLVITGAVGSLTNPLAISDPDSECLADPLEGYGIAERFSQAPPV